MAQNISWKEHRTNQELYQNIPLVSTKIQMRRLRLSGHCMRHEEEMAHKLILWEPKQGKRGRGRPATTYIDNLLEDTGLHDTNELRKTMLDRERWADHVNDAGRPDGRPR